MTTNADRTRDVLLNNFDNATAEIARMMDAKDMLIESVLFRNASLEREVDRLQAELVKANGLPI